MNFNTHKNKRGRRGRSGLATSVGLAMLFVLLGLSMTADSSGVVLSMSPFASVILVLCVSSIGTVCGIIPLAGKTTTVEKMVGVVLLLSFAATLAPLLIMAM